MTGTFIPFIISSLIPLVLSKGLTLDSFKPCKTGNYPFEFVTEKVDIVDNQLSILGNLSANLKNQIPTLPITVQYKYCSIKTKVCSSMNSFQVKNACKFLMEQSFLGPRLSQYFDPPLTCPVTKGNYRVNLKLPLRLVAKMKILDGNMFQLRYILHKDGKTLYCLDVKAKKEI